MSSDFLLQKIGSTQVYTIKSGRWKQNGYIITLENNESYIVDPGGNEEVFLEILKRNQLDVKSILLTHAHHDHVGGLKKICEFLEMKFHIHNDDYKIFRRAPMFALTFESRKLEIPVKKELFYSESFYNTDNLVYGIKTPGHTKGGIVIKIGNVAFTGDTLLNRMVGRTDLPGACPEVLSDSISHFLSDLEEDIILFPGHGESWSVKEAKSWWEVYKNKAPEYRDED